jgi:hypothetical protein
MYQNWGFGLEINHLATLAERRSTIAHDRFSGLPDFSWYKIPKGGKIYQMTTKYIKWPQNISNSSKIDQMVIKYT